MSKININKETVKARPGRPLETLEAIILDLDEVNCTSSCDKYQIKAHQDQGYEDIL